MNDLHKYGSVEKRIYRFQEQWIPRRVAGVTVASRALEALVQGMGISGDRLLYLPNCVAERAVGDGKTVRQRCGFAPDAPVVLLYTRFFEFSQEKLHILFAEIHRQLPQVRFLVVGKGRCGEEKLLVEAAATLGFKAALVAVGWVEPAQLPDYLAAADLALYPFADTLLNQTKCPAKLTELLVAGVPVVAHGVGQIAEYIAPDVSGVLCPPEDWQLMADRAVALLQSPAELKRLGQAGRSFVLDCFNWRDYGAKLERFYASGP